MNRNFTYLYALFLIILSSTLVRADLPFTRQKEFLMGPQKDWSPRKYHRYYRWMERKMDRVVNDDPQILRRQYAIITGNKITSEIWNYGSISKPGNRVTDILWEGLGYGYEFGPFIAAEVQVEPNSHPDAYYKVEDGDTTWYARVISDGLVDGPERSPDGSEYWTWEPLAYNDQGIQYADFDHDKIPTSNDIDRDLDGKPDSWAEDWYNPNLQEYVWPGALRQGSSNSDEEAFFVCDDRMNKEFSYYPFPDDSSRKGLGLEVEFRYYQWSNPLAEDIIFLIYKVTNISPKDLHEVMFGMWGDPHVGGPSNYSDDLSFFDQDINMVYCWDEDGLSDVTGRVPGYFGYKFLESPGNPYDGIDNDNDGLVDESRSNGIDDDSDWNPEKDDVGIDGVPNSGDEGEGDGIPTSGDQFDIRKPGEPNFEWTDLDESDMVGLTGFSAPPWSGMTISDDDRVFNDFMTPGVFDSANATQAGDYVFIYSSGPIELPAGESRRFSIALLLGEDYDDLTLNAITAQDIYEKNYQFAKPPEKPKVTAVPGDEKVTLYWDAEAESSLDPISEQYDFEGYVIYRSTDPQFLDQQTITDANGSKFLFEPLKMVNGASARFDLDNDYVGLSDIVYPNRGTYYTLGSNSGIIHDFVDSNNVINGQTYYYAVVSYDHGDVPLEIPPSECSKTITIDPETNEVILDVNTHMIIPRAPALGYSAGNIKNNVIEHLSGTGNGDIELDIINSDALEDENSYELTFLESPTRYNLKDLAPVDESIMIRLDQYVGLANANIDSNSFNLTDGTGNEFVLGVDFELNAELGKVLGLTNGSLSNNTFYTASYLYSPIVESEYLQNEAFNPFFDGLRIRVRDYELALDAARTEWAYSVNSTWIPDVKPFNGISSRMYPADYEVRFFDDIADSSCADFEAYAHSKMNFQVWDVTNGRVPAQKDVVIIELSNPDSLWSPGDRALILNGEPKEPSWEFTFLEPEYGDTIPSQGGDIFYIGTHRSFSAEDTLRFSTVASRVEGSLDKSRMDQISVVPNPYVVTNVLERLDLQNPKDRGPRKIYFNHLPQECTIKIYTVAGDHIQTLFHSSGLDDGTEHWDLTTKDNFPLAFGMYIYHVNAPGIGEKVGRFAVIK